jgi:hypothetical protein
MQLVNLIAQAEWKPGIGDPTVVGWITVFAYFVAAFCCVRRAVLNRTNHKRQGPALVWWCLAVAMFLLGVNKQLDLQSWLTVTLRNLALRQGWYERRREYQVITIQCMIVVSMLGTGGLLLLLRKWWSEFWLTLIGFGLLAAFIVVRAASFHHVDLLLDEDLFGLRWNAIIELSGIACIALGAKASWKHWSSPTRS